MMNETVALVENNEVIENVLEDVVVVDGVKNNSLVGIGIGAGVVVAGFVIAKTAPKVIGAIRKKLNDRKATHEIEMDYVAEEMQAEESVEESDNN